MRVLRAVLISFSCLLCLPFAAMADGVGCPLAIELDDLGSIAIIDQLGTITFGQLIDEAAPRKNKKIKCKNTKKKNGTLSCEDPKHVCKLSGIPKLQSRRCVRTVRPNGKIGPCACAITGSLGSLDLAQ